MGENNGMQNLGSQRSKRENINKNVGQLEEKLNKITSKILFAKGEKYDLKKWGEILFSME